MAKTYRDIAIEEMLGTVEEAMSQAINWWGDLPAPMKEAIEQFRTELGKQLMPWSLLEGHSTDKCTKLTTGKALPRLSTEPTGGGMVFGSQICRRESSNRAWQ